jgi:hypothetical protein
LIIDLSPNKEAGNTLLATSLFGDLAAALYEDASARLREHLALLRLLNLSPVLVLSAIRICPLAIKNSRRLANPITECDRVRTYSAPDPPYLYRPVMQVVWARPVKFSQ